MLQILQAPVPSCHNIPFLSCCSAISFESLHNNLLTVRPNKNNKSTQHLYFYRCCYCCCRFRHWSIGSNSKFMSSSSSSAAAEVHGHGNKTMWAKLGQRFNGAGIVSSLMVVLRDRNLALPHLVVRDIRSVDWSELKKAGFRGVVFDKDNTLTAPYSPTLWPTLVSSLEDCKSVFNGRVAVFSNSAGLYQYDPDGLEAKALQELIGIHVIRHGTKKPAGSAKDIENYFGCAASLIVMVGDRHFTDIVYGNRNGLLTILTEPLSLAEEPFIVKQIQKIRGNIGGYQYVHRIGLGWID